MTNSTKKNIKKKKVLFIETRTIKTNMVKLWTAFFNLKKKKLLSFYPTELIIMCFLQVKQKIFYIWICILNMCFFSNFCTCWLHCTGSASIMFSLFHHYILEYWKTFILKSLPKRFKRIVVYSRKIPSLHKASKWGKL